MFVVEDFRVTQSQVIGALEASKILASSGPENVSNYSHNEKSQVTKSKV